MQAETKFKRVVQRDLDKLMKCFPGWHLKTQERTIRGVPDVLACFLGRFVAIELKRSLDAEAEPLQRYTLLQIKKAGGFAEVAYPENWEFILGKLAGWLSTLPPVVK